MVELKWPAVDKLLLGVISGRSTKTLADDKKHVNDFNCPEGIVGVRQCSADEQRIYGDNR